MPLAPVMLLLLLVLRLHHDARALEQRQKGHLRRSGRGAGADRLLLLLLLVRPAACALPSDGRKGRRGRAAGVLRRAGGRPGKRGRARGWESAEICVARSQATLFCVSFAPVSKMRRMNG